MACSGAPAALNPASKFLASSLQAWQMPSTAANSRAARVARDIFDLAEQATFELLRKFPWDSMQRAAEACDGPYARRSAVTKRHCFRGNP
jgi:hypothetical protein